MAYNFVERATSNVQKENAYILFMIISSCFKKSKSKTKRIEKNLYLYYKEMPVHKQQARENQIIESVNNIVGKKRLEDLKCEVTIIILHDGCYEIIFKTWVEDIRVIVYGDGKYEIKMIHM